MMYLSVLLLLGVALVAQASDPTRMAKFRTAYLYQDGDQTSCMAAIIDSRAAFITASCITLDDGKPDLTIKYKIHFSTTKNEEGPMISFTGDQVTFHPNYNPKTLENNIAIIQYDDDTTDGELNLFATKEFTGKTFVYNRRDYDIYENFWKSPQVFNQDSNDNDCESASPLFAANPDRYSCTSALTASFATEFCSIPYGVMYKQDTLENVLVSGIYSHSVDYGKNMCGDFTKVVSYYTLLWPYLGFAVNTLARGVSAFNATDRLTYTDTTMITMTAPTADQLQNTVVENGDLYPKQWVIEEAITNSASAVIGTQTASGDNSGDDNSVASSVESSSAGGGDSNNSSSDGLSQGQKIAIGVAVPASVIIITIGCIILYHIWKSKRQDKAWDPDAEASNLRTIALEMNTGEPYLMLPPYSQASGIPDSYVHHPLETDDKKVEI
ncbi:hypothetical protein H4217_000775 [Coemansia sp. RSA 1939]|nr:hypothetical protein H4217_000775 [Coemansia sp. RSA 1939]